MPHVSTSPLRRLGVALACALAVLSSLLLARLVSPPAAVALGASRGHASRPTARAPLAHVPGCLTPGPEFGAASARGDRLYASIPSQAASAVADGGDPPRARDTHRRLLGEHAGCPPRGAVALAAAVATSWAVPPRVAAASRTQDTTATRWIRAERAPRGPPERACSSKPV